MIPHWLIMTIACMHCSNRELDTSQATSLTSYNYLLLPFA
jgi:hypothetical protein